jgi:hypothetical protein
MFMHVHQPAGLQLFEIVRATNPLSAFFGFGENWQQERRENGDDGYDDKQFHQRKCAPQSNIPFVETVFPHAVKPTSVTEIGARDFVRESSYTFSPGYFFLCTFDALPLAGRSALNRMKPVASSESD